MSCYICNGEDTQTHHRVLRKECKPLENCEKNKVRLCVYCHDFIHKNPKGYKKLKELKLEFQNELEMFFDKELLTREEIKEVLEIKDKPLNTLLKSITLTKGMYAREDVIRACMGGRIILPEEVI